MTKRIVIQIGDKPGWKRPVLNLVDMKSGEVISTRISRKTAEWLKSRGMTSEG